MDCIWSSSVGRFQFSGHASLRDTDKDETGLWSVVVAVVVVVLFVLIFRGDGWNTSEDDPLPFSSSSSSSSLCPTPCLDTSSVKTIESTFEVELVAEWTTSWSVLSYSLGLSRPTALLGLDLLLLLFLSWMVWPLVLLPRTSRL